jgi:hypothetical protein
MLYTTVRTRHALSANTISLQSASLSDFFFIRSFATNVDVKHQHQGRVTRCDDPPHPPLDNRGGSLVHLVGSREIKGSVAPLIYLALASRGRSRQFIHVPALSCIFSLSLSVAVVLLLCTRSTPYEGLRKHSTTSLVKASSDDR